jgi:osmotically-inducible protein OsmY
MKNRMEAFMTVTNKTSHSTTQKIKEYIGNYAITAKVKVLFEAEPSINSPETHVTTEDGIVELSGKTSSKNFLIR